MLLEKYTNNIEQVWMTEPFYYRLYFLELQNLEYFSFLEVTGWSLDIGKAIKFLLVYDIEKKE